MKSGIGHIVLLVAAMICSLCLAPRQAGAASEQPTADQASAESVLKIAGEAALFLPGIASTPFSEVRLTLSPDGRTALWFSRDRPGGAGRHDLYTARQRAGQGFEPARRLPGRINTPADEFDATFLSDGATLVFARAADFRADRVDLYFSAMSRDGGYDAGTVLPQTVNSGEHDTYGPMLDWSQPDRFTVSARRAGAAGMDLYLVRYTLERASSQ